MTHYADPQRCPDCRGPIQFGARSCPTCALPLEGPTAQQLFTTLTRADELLRNLRNSKPSLVTPTATAPAPTLPVPTTTAPVPKGGLRTASVPGILLGLGAACLLVAALVFLAVTWSVMDVAGRTATLVGITLVAGALTAWLSHRGLRAAAESLSLVALGLFAFDLIGARDSGWFGDITLPTFLVVLGALVAVAGAAAALAVRRTPTPALTGAEIVAALGIATICVGLTAHEDLTTSSALTLAVALAAGAGFAASRLRLVVLTVGSATVSGCFWLVLTASSFDRAFANPTAHALWVDLEVWPLLVAAASAGAVALVRSIPTPARVAGPAVAELILAGVALIPFTQGTGTELTLAVLAVVVFASALTSVAPMPWAWASAVTTGLAGLWTVGVACVVSLNVVSRIGEAGEHLWTGPPGGRLPEAYDGLFEAWLLPIAVAAAVVTIYVLARLATEVATMVMPFGAPVVLAALASATAIGTLAAYPMPVWLICGLMLLVAVANVGWALHRRDWLPLVLGTVFASGAIALGLYDEWLTATALLTTLVLSTLAHLRWSSQEVRAVAGFVVASSLAASIWTWGAIGGAEETWTALTVIIGVAVLVLVRPVASLWPLEPSNPAVRRTAPDRSTVGTEIGTAAAMLVFGLAGVAGAPHSQDATWTAVYLTAAGVAVSAQSLLRSDRRHLGWVGGLLLAMASWVRLWDIGVHSPEAYTLPSAAALILVGIVHLRRHPEASTLTALAPGLGLALVPSLLWVLWEPATVRSLLLGTACLLMLIAGARVRWTAPVVFGATVLALVVLRHAAPFVDQAVPRWVLIAAAGSLLIGTGVTWERRMLEARAVASYVRTLR